MTKKTMLSVAIATAAATGAIKGYQLLGKRYGHQSTQKKRYQLPRDAQPIMVHTSIGDFKLFAAGGYFGGSGIFVYAENLVDPDAFNRKVLRGDSISHTHVVPIVTQELTTAFFEATEGKFHLDISPHTASGGDSSAFALITAGINHEAYLKHNGVNPYKHLYGDFESGPTNEELDNWFKALPSYSGYFKNSDAPTMRMAAHTLRTIIDGSLSDRAMSDLRAIAEGALPVHTLHDLHKATITTKQIVRHYQAIATDRYATVKASIGELIKSKD